MSLFGKSKVFQPVSDEVRRLVANAGTSRLPPRDPAMYGDHHKCNACGESARYIAKNTHWCRYCLDSEEYPHLVGLSQEDRDKIKEENLAKINGARLVNAENLKNPGSIGFK